MKVMLLVPPGGYFAERWTKGTLMPALGILYIAAYLENKGMEVKVVPSEVLELKWREIEKEISNYKPDVVGVTTTTENRFLAFELIRRSKKVYPTARTVIGGPHASMAAQDALEHIPELDFVVRGEGEITTYELVKALESKKEDSLSKIPGISYRINGKIFINPSRSPLHDLDLLPFPARHLIPYEKYNFYLDVPGKGKLPAANLMTSRGCPFECNFCATPINWGRIVRSMSPEKVVEEIEYVINRYNAKAIWFYDDTFNFNPKRVEKICDLIMERDLDIQWTCELRIDVMTKELLSKMKKAGLYYVSFGVEAGSERIRKEIIKKNIKLEHLYNIVRWCKELEILSNCFFIFSHPTETWQEAKETINIIERLKNDSEISISILHIYPGTNLEKKAKEMGKFPEDFTWTKKKDKRIITLPAAQGYVPLFQDKLSWADISELVFRWSFSKKGISYLRKIPVTLTSINSLSALKRYLIMFLVFLKVKILKIYKS
ncbi:MAG: radical SAM protein [Acidobacteriota bacterium]